MSSHIRFAPDILRRLGEELNPSIDQGILELVKNAYDADALTCTVELINTDGVGGMVRIEDDGDGMDRQDLENSWLVIGQSKKSKHTTTRLGRIPAGSKGLGRLAALRLGDAASIATRARNEPSSEHSLAINWTAFDNAAVVEDVPLQIETAARSDRPRSGTEIQLRGIRSKVSRLEVKRLARGLILLADPFGLSPEGFRPQLKAPEFRDLEALVSKRYFDDAEYHLSAQLVSGTASAQVLDWKGRQLFAAKHDTLSQGREGREYETVDASLDLWVFILNKPTFETRTTSVEEVRTWLREFGGVHLYENGLRVLPYGNPGNDWLDLNLRRAQSPEERPSTNTSIGRIAVNDRGSLLTQKTDRTGYIESFAFMELRAFAQDAVEWMAKRRLEVAMKRRAGERADAPRRSREAKRNLEQVVQSIPTKTRKVVEAALSQYAGAQEKEVRELRKEVQLYRTLSTAGITAATFAHEATGNPIKVMTVDIRTIQRRAIQALGSEQYASKLKEPIERMSRSVESLAVLGTATLRLLDHSKRRQGRVDIHAVVRGVLETFEPFISARNVTVVDDLSSANPHLRGSEAAVESIVTNLVNNSLVALETTNSSNRTIRVRSSVSESQVTVSVADSGPGIVGIGIDDIWLAGQTTKPNGTGLGLTIVTDSVSDLGGSVEAVQHSDLGGAEIRIHLPILGA